MSQTFQQKLEQVTFTFGNRVRLFIPIDPQPTWETNINDEHSFWMHDGEIFWNDEELTEHLRENLDIDWPGAGDVCETPQGPANVVDVDVIRRGVWETVVVLERKKQSEQPVTERAVERLREFTEKLENEPKEAFVQGFRMGHYSGSTNSAVLLETEITELAFDTWHKINEPIQPVEIQPGQKWRHKERKVDYEVIQHCVDRWCLEVYCGFREPMHSQIRSKADLQSWLNEHAELVEDA